MISEPMVCLAQTVQLSYTDINTILKWTKTIPQDPHNIGVPSGASEMIYNHVVHLAQTVQLSSVKITTISKQNEMSIHLSLVPKEYHWVRPK
jgi:hypothetical protein